MTKSCVRSLICYIFSFLSYFHREMKRADDYFVHEYITRESFFEESLNDGRR